MNGSAVYRLAPGVRLRRESGGGAFLLIPEGVVDLSSSAADVLELIDGTRSEREIVARLADLYDAPADVLDADVRALCEAFRSRGYLHA